MVKCPCCQSEKLYFRFEDGFDWESNQQAIVNVECETCGIDFLVYIGATQVIPDSWERA